MVKVDDLEERGKFSSLHPHQPPPHPKKLKYLTTLAIFFGNITFGSSLNFFSPALEELRAKYDTTVEEISFVFTIMLIGYCSGALSCGIIYNYMNRQLGVIICMGGVAFALFATPYCDSKTWFFAIGALLGYFIGAYDASQIVWIIEIWQEKAGPFIQAQHFCYALGLNIPALLFGPFLMGDASSKLKIPFTIGGAFSTTAFAFQLLLFIFCRYYVPPMYATATEGKPRVIEYKGIIGFLRSPRMRMIIVTGVYVGAYVGMELCVMQFIPTFGQYSNLKLSESDAAFVLTGLTGAFTLGRFIGIFIIMKVHPVPMLFGNLLLVLIGNLILLLWANDNVTMFWIACVTLGAGFSTQYAGISVFMEKNLVVTNAIGSYIIVCGSFTAAIYPLIVGNSIEQNAVVLSYPIFFSVGIASLALGVGWWMSRGKSVRY